MATTGKSKPSKLSIPQLTEIHISHPPIGKAIQALLDYINLNVEPKQGTRVQPK